MSARYKVTETVSFGFGVNNLADKRLFREANSSDAGAATYNEAAHTGPACASASDGRPARARVACNVINIVIVSSAGTA